jgi:hypothetical protein
MVVMMMLEWNLLWESMYLSSIVLFVLSVSLLLAAMVLSPF